MPLRDLRILKSHGRQYIADLNAVELPGSFKGRPVIHAGITPQEAQEVAGICPAGAIATGPCRIDLGKCLFCKECHFTLPEKITFSKDPLLAANSREGLIITQGEDVPISLDPDKIRNEIRSYFRYALKLRQVSAGGDNSAEMELNAAGNVNFDMGRYGIEFVASPRHADGIVITGPVTYNMAEALKATYDAIPSPKIIILAGTDAISGGLFADSPAISRSFLDDYPVDLYIPGNPPHPLTFILGVRALLGFSN